MRWLESEVLGWLRERLERLERREEPLRLS
ncbi:MAG: hypothetical protein AAF416_14875 [Pseudomonadota bacterium]